jgi:hypothetical protein
VPSTVAVVAELAAIIMLFQKLRQSSRSVKSLLYHRSENPVQRSPGDSLKEETTKIISGKKRKIIAATKTTAEKVKCLRALLMLVLNSRFADVEVIIDCATGLQQLMFAYSFNL